MSTAAEDIFSMASRHAVEQAKQDRLQLVHLVISQRCGPGTDTPRTRLALIGPLPRELEKQLDDLVAAWLERA